MDSLAFVSKVSPLIKATADDGDPIPGYLLDDIKAISFESPVVISQLVDFLSERLEKNSHHVKLKALRVMKHIVEHGSDDFRQLLRMRSRGIQAASNYNGPPDEIHGNAPYAMVRKSAKELNEILFDIEGDDKQASHQPAEPSHSPSASTGNSRGLRGFGNTPSSRGFGNTPPQTEKSVGDKILSSLTDLSHKLTASPTHHTRQYERQSQGSYKPAAPHAPFADDTTLPHALTVQNSSPKKHVPGRAGGGWEDDDTCLHGNTGSSGSDGAQSYKSEASLKDMTDWSEEQSLIADCLKKEGGRLLSRNELNSFINKCCSYNCDKIVELINVELVKDISSETKTTRVLQLIETLMNTDMVSLDSLVESCRHNLARVHAGATSSALQKARKILLTMERLSNHPHLLPSPVASPITDTTHTDTSTTPQTPHDTQHTDIDTLALSCSVIDTDTTARECDSGNTQGCDSYVVIADSDHDSLTAGSCPQTDQSPPSSRDTPPLPYVSSFSQLVISDATNCDKPTDYQ